MALKKPIKKRPAKKVLKERVCPEYLMSFPKKCVRDFDVTWVISELSSPVQRPAWFRKMLMLMLLGQLFSPSRKLVRKSLAWHYANEIIHHSTLKEIKAYPTYSWAMIGGAFNHREGIGRIHRPLGGWNSKQKLSWRELRNEMSKAASAAEVCLFTFDVAVSNFESDVNAISAIPMSLSAAQEKIRHWHEFHNGRSKNQNSTSSKKKYKEIFGEVFEGLFRKNTQLLTRSISDPNHKKNWQIYKDNYEFIAALFSMMARKDFTPIKVGRTFDRPVYKSAMRYVMAGEFDRLPLGNKEFQTQLIGRAKYFSKFMPHKEQRRMNDRFAGVTEIPATLDIVVLEALKSNKSQTPQTEL